MEIEDFIPDYPSRTDPEFNDKIFRIQEFNELRTGEENVHPGPTETLYNHQHLVARFMSPYTQYDSMLLYHTPGTGKTCAAIAIAEAALKSTAYGIDKVIILVPTSTLVRQWRESIAGICTGGKYLPTPDENRTRQSREIQITKRISAFYEIKTHGEFANEVSRKLSDQTIVNMYSNKLFIVDEAHNLRIQAKPSLKKKAKKEADPLNLTKLDSVEQYTTFLRVFRLVRSCKKLLLTGTPMVDDANELASLFNLILPVKEYLPTGAKFTREYISSDRNLDALRNKLVGRVSYIREGGHAPTRIDQGTKGVFTKYINTVAVKAGKGQKTGYIEARKKDKGRGSDGDSDSENATAALVQNTLHSNKRDAINFVYFGKTKPAEYIWGDRAVGELCSVSVTKTAGAASQYRTFHIKREYKKDIKERLPEFSAVYTYIRDFIKTHPTEPTFIFNPMVSGTGGVEFMAAVLELFELQRVSYVTGLKPDPTRRRFALITGQSPNRAEILRLFNSPENRNGDVIHTLVGTLAISEGVDLVNVRNVLIRPYWNNSVVEQAIARGIRANSLSWLPASERKVSVYRLLTYFDDPAVDTAVHGSNVDIHMYQMSEQKDKNIKGMERILREVAFDCPLNYKRNVKPEFKTGSRDCDYTKCKYTCYQVESDVPPYTSFSAIGQSAGKGESGTQGYYIEFAKPKIQTIKADIRNFLQRNGSGYVDRLIIESGSDRKLVIAAIMEMVAGNEVAPNRYGQQCFIRYKFGSLFLTPIISFHEDYYFLNYYAKHPMVETITPLKTIVQDSILDRNMMIIHRLPGLVSKGKPVIDKLKALEPDTKLFIIEYLMSLALDDPSVKNSSIYKYFSKYIFDDGDAIFHTFARITACGIDERYFDFEIGTMKGRYRCLDPDTGVFTECIDKKGARAEVDVRMKKEIDRMSSDKELYGVDINCKFNLRDSTKKKSKLTGATCGEGNWTVTTLKDLVKKKKLPIPVTKTSTTTTLCTDIEKYLRDNDQVVEWLG